MDQQAEPAVDLGEIRHEIDVIDDAVLKLLQDRFDIIAKVKRAKAEQGKADLLPLRPDREAIILRRLTQGNDSRLPNDLLIKLWRSIICRSTLAQARVQINASSQLLDQPVARQILENHFVDFPLKPYNKIKMALNSAAKSNFELCAITTDSKWIEHLQSPDFKEFSVILALPFEGKKGPRHIIILGKTSNQPTGDDETLLISQGKLPRDFVPTPLWQVKTADGQTLTCLPGFLLTHDSPLAGLMSGNRDLALKVLGRYPSVLKV